MHVLELVKYCDYCYQEFAEKNLSSGDDLVAAVDGNLYVIDLCEDHQDLSFSDFTERLRVYGRPWTDNESKRVKKKKQQPRRMPVTGKGHTCECGEVFNSSQGLKMHHRRSKNHN